MATSSIRAEDSNPSSEYAWQSDPIRPPDFEGFFPLDAQAGKKLDALHKAADRDLRSDGEILTTVRNGFRATTEHRTLILSWIGNRYIWNKPRQNPAAIEIMYHAIASPDHGVSHYAVYFGLSVTRPKTPAILQTLVSFAMADDDPNNLDRIAWGCANQKEELLALVEPLLSLPDAAEREKAQDLNKIFSGELKAFKWADDRAIAGAQQAWGGKMPALKEQFLNGAPESRREALKTLMTTPAGALMDDTYLPGFAAFADDPDARLRAEIARTALNRWIWSAKEQTDPAIELALKFSRDPDPEVRGRAVYFGLSTIRKPSDAVMRRMVELLLDPPAPDAWGRLLWGMNRNRDQAAAVLDEYLARAASDPQSGLKALMAWRELMEKDPPDMGRFEPLLADAPHLIVLTAREPFKPADAGELWNEAATSVGTDSTAVSERRWMADETGIYVMLRIAGRASFQGVRGRLSQNSRLEIKHADILGPEHEARMNHMERME